MYLDKFDFVPLDIIQIFKKSAKGNHINLSDLESSFWTRIQYDISNHEAGLHIGERITNLYLEGYIVFKSGYALTRKGKESLQMQKDTLTISVP